MSASPDHSLQSFDDVADSSQSAQRIAALRQEMAKLQLDGWIVPKADRHQSEYTPPCAERLAWLTGFTGSAGLAIILKDKAALFVDGRYTLQAAEQADGRAISVVASAETTPEAWLSAQASPKSRIGYDPWLHTKAQFDSFERAAKDAGAELHAVEANLIDAIWTDRPGEPLTQVRTHPEKWAGESAMQKLTRIRTAIDDVDALLVSDPHALAWTFNIRGADVSYTPISFGWSIIFRDARRPLVFIDGRKLTAEARAHLAGVADIVDPCDLSKTLEGLARSGASIFFDSATAPVALLRLTEAAGGRAVPGRDPIAAMKARKNKAELAGARAAHLRDGLALTRFLCWFESEAPNGGLTEITAALALEKFRTATGALKDLSFPTISAFGPHGALPHYRVTRASDSRIKKGLYLVDSGAQYLDGTTDVTRTVAVGEPSLEMRDRFTRVLKGHIAIAMSVFPEGTTGAQLDPFARRALWEAGLDFNHGTGHGVGSYLSVHEGPQRISKLGGAALTPGMILSNEPAYYKADKWGIRIENLLVVAPRKVPGAERPVYGFDTLTLAPIDRHLILVDMLNEQERAWIDDYHARVRDVLTPKLDGRTAKWLTHATKPLRAGALKSGRRARATRLR